MISPKVREKVSNQKPSTSGYETVWERLKRHYGHTNLVVNAHMDAIVGLQVVKGSNYEKIKELFEKVSQRYDALQTLGQSQMLKGFVLSTLNKLPHIRSDLVRTDDNWENWSMKDLLESLQQWWKRNNMATDMSKSPPPRPPDNPKGAKEKHWVDSCPSQDTREKRKAFLLHVNCVSTGDLQVIELASVEVEDVIYVKGGITQVYAIVKRTRILS